MTVTETKPVEADEPSSTEVVPAAPLAPPPPPPEGPIGMLGTADHKTIGKLLGGLGLLFLGGALVLAALVAFEGADASSFQLLDENTYFQVSTLSVLGMVLLGAMPALLGVAIYVVPLQIGASSIAFPRLAASSLWTWLVGSALVIASYIINGGPGGGKLEGVLLTYVSLGMVVLGLLGGCICVFTTVATLRTTGLTLLRTPAFSWSMLVASSVWLITLPVLGANLLLMYIDTNYGRLSFGQPLNAWPQLRWFFDQPAVLGLAIPVLGVAAEVVPVLGRSKIAVRGAVLGTIGAFGVLTFGPWAQTAFHPRLVDQALYLVFSVAVGLPVLALLGGLMDTLRRGRPRTAAALPLALIGVLGTLAACVCAALRAIQPLDLDGTTWGTGVPKLAIGACVAGLVAALHYWGPKLWGSHPSEALGKLNVLVVIGGVTLFGGGDLLAGGLGQLPADALGSFAEVVDGAEIGFALSAVGALLLAVAVDLALLGQLGAMASKSRRAGADPWDGHTLEWAVASPPPYGNFLAEVPPVGSATPLSDLRDGEEKA